MKYTTICTAAVTAATIAAPSYAHENVRNLRADDGDESLTAASPEPQFFTDWWKYLWKKPEVKITIFTGDQLLFDTHAKQKLQCENQGQRLCKLAEICPNRPEYYAPFSQASIESFTPGIAGNQPVGTDSWVAYDTDDETRKDNCNTVGGCPGNGWVQIGLWGGIAPAGATCNTHCEAQGVFSRPQSCPSWGTISPVWIIRSYSASLSSSSSSSLSTKSLLKPMTLSSVPSILSICSLTSGCSIIKPPAQLKIGAFSANILSTKSPLIVGLKCIVAV